MESDIILTVIISKKFIGSLREFQMKFVHVKFEGVHKIKTIYFKVHDKYIRSLSEVSKKFVRISKRFVKSL